MNNSGLEKLFTKCKSLGYPNSKEEFEKDFQQFVVSELDSSQLESISGGSVKNKICASALSALSVLGATSSAGAVNSTKGDNNYAGKSSGRSWLSKHKEAVITGAVSLGLSGLIASPFIYKQAGQSIKYNTIKNRIKKLIPWYFTVFYTRGHVDAGSRSDIVECIEGINGLDSNEVNKKLEEIFGLKLPKDLKNLKNLYEDINAKIRKFDDQVKKLMFIGYRGSYTCSIPFHLYYEEYDILNRMIRKFSDKDICSYITKKYNISSIVYFCPETLYETPKMVVPSNQDGTEAELINFSTEFLNPNYGGEHKEKLEWLRLIKYSEEKNKNFLKAAGEVLGVGLDNNSEPQTTNEHDTNDIELADQ